MSSLDDAAQRNNMLTVINLEKRVWLSSMTVAFPSSKLTSSCVFPPAHRPVHPASHACKSLKTSGNGRASYLSAAPQLIQRCEILRGDVRRPEQLTSSPAFTTTNWLAGWLGGWITDDLVNDYSTAAGSRAESHSLHGAADWLQGHREQFNGSVSGLWVLTCRPHFCLNNWVTS